MNIFEEVCKILQQIADYNLGKDVCPGNTRVLWLKEELEKRNQNGCMAYEPIVRTKITTDRKNLQNLQAAD